MDNLLVSGSDSAPLRVLLAHGAGAGMDSPFMAAMADGLAEQGWQVLLLFIYFGIYGRLQLWRFLW